MEGAGAFLLRPCLEVKSRFHGQKTSLKHHIRILGCELTVLLRLHEGLRLEEDGQTTTELKNLRIELRKRDMQRV